MKLTPEKRNKLIAVGVITAGVIGALWYYVIGAQETRLRDIQQKQTETEDQRQKMVIASKNAAAVERQLEAGTARLAEIQKDMASGDLYSWMYNTIKTFKAGYRVDIPQISTVEEANNNLLYKFPFRQAKITVNGSGLWHDIGKFIADLENRYPHIRVENLVLEPVGGAEKERLGFRMEIIALVNAAPTAAADPK
jgi:Tfp pilus assembly protein PilO